MSFLPAEAPQGLEVTHQLFIRLEREFEKEPSYSNHYIGSWLNEGIYSLTYTELGKLLSEMFVLWEDGEMFSKPLEALDGNNGFEEFVNHVLDHQFSYYGVIDSKDKIRIDRLATVWTALVAQNENRWEEFRAIIKGLEETRTADVDGQLKLNV